ncbi:rhoptry kinase family protein ROP24 (incomplete catalytic triad) [Toxoplasma gondii RUB]|uniref:non-specific serine/threonine protein kinase n=1 Tax=Toxoplasma gondii RUB TaxID=935652 RepID=A0A086LMT0_TOXGO|nr:rhoptry kinase family protein ROP24 (incomplete catalytic triad) [Toxoplasma gondii RUB]
MATRSFLFVFLALSSLGGLCSEYATQRPLEPYRGETERPLPERLGQKMYISVVQHKTLSFSRSSGGPFRRQNPQTWSNFVQLTSTSGVPHRRRERIADADEPTTSTGNRRDRAFPLRSWLRHAIRRLGVGANNRRQGVQHKEVLPSTEVASIVTLLQQLQQEIGRCRLQQRTNAHLEDTVTRLFFRRGSTRVLLSDGGRHTRNIRYDGEILSSGPWSLVLRVMDVDENQEYALKVARLRASLSGAAGYRQLLRQGLLHHRFTPPVSPHHALWCLQLMVAIDLLKLPRIPRFVREPSSRLTIANRFLLLPLAYTDLLAVLRALFARQDVSESPGGFLARLHMTAQVVKALASYHSQGFVHGDLKPQKFLVMANGSLVLGGFTEVRTPGALRSGDVFTESYLPPEHLDRNSVYSFESDTWQLGLTIYQIWCLLLPFGLMTPFVAEGPERRVFEEVVQHPGVQPSFNDPDCFSNVPEYIEMMVHHMLQFHPEDRPRPADILISDNFQRLQDHIQRLERSQEEEESVHGSPAGTLSRNP